MNKTEITIKKISASKGHILTDGAVFSKIVYLGKYDSADSWHEISLEEYERIKEETKK